MVLKVHARWITFCYSAKVAKTKSIFALYFFFAINAKLIQIVIFLWKLKHTYVKKKKYRNNFIVIS